MASVSQMGKYFRHWNNSDSLEPSDICRLYETDRVTVKSGKSWRTSVIFYLVFIAFVTLFLFGILVGFYVRESQKVSSTCVNQQRRTDGLDREKLQSVHQNIMYYVSPKSIENYERKLEELAQVSAINSEKGSADFVAKELKKFGLDRVTIEEHSIVVTYPDPHKSNRLEVLNQNGSAIYNVTFGGKKVSTEREDSKKSDELEIRPLTTFSRSGVVEGKLLYANYGEYVDYVLLHSLNITIRDAVVLVRHGKSSYSTKMKLAQKYGVSGLLVFCHPDDCPYKTEFSTPANHLPEDDQFYQSIPSQTVSADIASKLLRHMPRSSLPSSWLPSIMKLSTVLVNSSGSNVTVNSIRSVVNVNSSRSDVTVNSSGTDVKVRLAVNNVKSARTIHNVIATIPGGMESDRNVIIGARRISQQSTLVSSSTAILLEIARSLAYIKRFEGWIPRRGIKICSWGGLSTDNTGVMNHIATDRENIRESTVSYIDLDGMWTHNDVMNIVTSPGIVNLVRKAAEMVPDPNNREISVGENWPAIVFDDLWNGNTSLNIYDNVNLNTFPMLASLGVTTIQMTSKSSTNQTKREKHKNLLSLARVAALILTSLVDRELLPVSVETFSEFVIKIFRQILTLKQNWSAEITESLFSAVEELNECSDNWRFLQQNLPQCPSELKVRQFNNILARLDGHFITDIPYHRTGYLLTHERGDDTLKVLKDAVEEYKLSKKVQRLDHVLSLLISSLQNLSSSLCQLKHIL